MFAALAVQQAVGRITAENLADMLQTRSGNEIALVDCREDDYDEGGHVRGSTNVPAEDFDDDDNVQDLVQRMDQFDWTEGLVIRQGRVDADQCPGVRTLGECYPVLGPKGGSTVEFGYNWTG